MRKKRRKRRKKRRRTSTPVARRTKRIVIKYALSRICELRPADFWLKL